MHPLVREHREAPVGRHRRDAGALLEPPSKRVLENAHASVVRQDCLLVRRGSGDTVIFEPLVHELLPQLAQMLLALGERATTQAPQRARSNSSLQIHLCHR